MFPRIENFSFAETGESYRPYPKNIHNLSLYQNKIVRDTGNISSLKKLKDYLCDEQSDVRV